MEYGNSLKEEIERSPSQENTACFQTMKRDVESLEDFEEITKDEPSFKDLTAQFLQFEKGGSPEKLFKDEFNLGPDEIDLKREGKDESPVNFSHEGLGGKPEGHDFQLESLKDPNDLKTSEVDFKNSYTDLLSFEDPYSQTKFENIRYLVTEKSENILDENKSSDVFHDGNFVGNDDLSLSPERGESSPVMYSDFEKKFPDVPLSEHISNISAALTEPSIITQPLLKFTSEPGLNIKDKKMEGLLGDGLHVKDEAEVSDNEDIVPEPIPKDYPEIGVIKGKEFLAAIGIDTWFHPHLLNPRVESLIYWRDPKKSGIVFGSVLVILLSLTTFSLISVLAHTSLLVLVAALAFRIYKSVLQAVQKTSDGHPFKTYLDAVVNNPIITAVFFTIEEYLDVDLTVNPEKAREVSDVVISQVNKVLTKCRSLFLVEDVIDSVKFAILLWCLTYVGAWFNGLSLLIIAFVGLFTLPKVYENNKAQIDANIDIVKSKINDVSDKIRAVIPLGKKPEEVKDKGE